MKKAMHKTALAALAFVLANTAACTNQGMKSRQNTSQTQNAGNPAQTAAPRVGTLNIGGTTAPLPSPGGIGMPGTAADGSIPVCKFGNEDYVDANKLMNLVGFNSVWDSNMKVLKFGDNDAAFEVKSDSTEARREEDRFHLKNAPITQDGVLYLPVSAVGDLLTDECQFSKQGDRLVFQPAPDQGALQMNQNEDLPPGDALHFGEDPQDPYKDLKIEEAASVQPDDTGEDGAVAAAALRNINIPALLSRARTYLGVPYQFGAAPYSQSGRFDCSSYTQYLFGKYGISLPRTARAQARLGNPVSRNNLRKGDLLFFYVPGRFQSNKTVGHVGIYIGDYKMINANTAPKNGVQITDINKAYWKRTYLYAKRIAY